MSAQEIPLRVGGQRFTITLGGESRQLTVWWNQSSRCYCVDVASADGTRIACGIPLVTGADLLGQLEYIGLGGAWIVQSDNDTNAVPTYANLGSTGHLYHVTP